MARAVSNSSDPGSDSGNAQTARCVAVGLFLLTALLFSRAVGNEFVNYDDRDYVTENAHVLGGLSGQGVRWALTANVASNWHPLTWCSHMLDVSLFGRNPEGHHATSVLLHAFNAAFAFLALWRLTGALWRSALCAALFAWHPLRVESVAWVAERKDVLSGLLFLVCLWGYANYVRRRISGVPALSWYVCALAACALGLMAKPMLVTLPCVLLLLDFWPLGRIRWGGSEGSNRPQAGSYRVFVEKLPFLVLSLASSAVTYVVQKQSGAVTAELTMGERLANAVVAVPRYVAKVVWPAELAALYPHPGHWPSWAVAGGVLFVAGGLAIAGIHHRRRPWLLVGILWFLGMLVPVCGIVQVGLQSMADRYTYLPVIGLEVAVVWTASESLGTARRAIWAVVLVLAALAGVTLAQIGVWRNSITLFRHTVAVAPVGNYLAHDNLGIALQDAGQVDAAVAEYEQSLAIRPDYPNANNNLGRVLADRGRLAEAIAHYQRALRVQPEQLEIHNNLANALSDAGRLGEAIEHYRFVLQRQPQHLNALNGYAVALAMKGSLTEAEQQFREVLRLDPGNLSALSNLGNVYAVSGRKQDALSTYQRVLDLNPNDPRTLQNLANVESELGQFEAAAENYRRAVVLAPQSAEAHGLYGLALARLGRKSDAVREFQTALQLRPDYGQARAWLEAAQKP